MNVSQGGRVNKKSRGAVGGRDISGSDSSARERERERCAERDGGKLTGTELTGRNQFQCEAESMLGATVTCGQCSVNTNKTLICLSKQI